MRLIKRFMSILFICVVALLVTALALLCYARFIEPRFLDIENVTIFSPHLHRDDKGLRIVQFSDLHVSDDDFSSKLTNLRDLVNSQDADILVFTGDLFDNYADYHGDINALIAVLSQMEARCGRYAILGNHDYEKNALNTCKAIWEEVGFTLLIGDTVTVPGTHVTVSGFDDLLYSRCTALKEEPTDGFRLFLCHEPDIAADINAARYDLMLSGHTHGGQVKLPFLGIVYLPHLGRIYAEGLYTPGNCDEGKLYVNRGIGMSLLPIRFRSVPEITVLTLTGEREES